MFLSVWEASAVIIMKRSGDLSDSSTCFLFSFARRERIGDPFDWSTSFLPLTSSICFRLSVWARLGSDFSSSVSSSSASSSPRRLLLASPCHRPRRLRFSSPCHHPRGRPLRPSFFFGVRIPRVLPVIFFGVGVGNF